MSGPAVVVTGAARGIGLAVAQWLVREGRPVVGIDLDGEGLARSPCAQVVEGDAGDWATHERAAALAQSEGGLGGWVNNAGIDLKGAAHEVDEEHLVRGVRALQLSAMFGTAVAVRQMLAGGGGAIVNVGSIQGAAAFPGYFAYQAAKAAIAMMSKGVAVDYGGQGIRCNVVLPGTIATPMTLEGLPSGDTRRAALDEAGRLAPMGRVGEPEEVADVVGFLLSSRSAYVNGVELPVDGGALARCWADPE